MNEANRILFYRRDGCNFRLRKVISSITNIRVMVKTEIWAKTIISPYSKIKNSYLHVYLSIWTTHYKSR